MCLIFGKKVEWAWNHPGEMEIMGRSARQEFERKYTARRNLAMLEEVYESVIAPRGMPSRVDMPENVTV